MNTKTIDRTRLADVLFDIANDLDAGDCADLRWLCTQKGLIRDAAHELLNTTQTEVTP